MQYKNHSFISDRGRACFDGRSITCSLAALNRHFARLNKNLKPKVRNLLSDAFYEILCALKVSLNCSLL